MTTPTPGNVTQAPWRGSPARLLPTGATPSAWPDLEPNARRNLVDQYLATYAAIVPSGAIDYERDREPLFLNQVDGNLVSLAGEVFPAGQGQTLAVTVRKPAEAAGPNWLLWGVGGLVLLAALS